jgi:hypothetical protein
MTEDEAARVIGHYAANLPTAAAYEAEDFLTLRQSANRDGDGFRFSDESVTFKHPLATFTIDRTTMTSDNVLPLIDALKRFCGRA